MKHRNKKSKLSNATIKARRMDYGRKIRRIAYLNQKIVSKHNEQERCIDGSAENEKRI